MLLLHYLLLLSISVTEVTSCLVEGAINLLREMKTCLGYMLYSVLLPLQSDPSAVVQIID